jgi:hypothetical protein
MRKETDKEAERVESEAPYASAEQADVRLPWKRASGGIGLESLTRRSRRWSGREGSEPEVAKHTTTGEASETKSN